MPVTDTSWLVALFNVADAHHRDAKTEARDARRLVVPGPVLTEFLNLVVFRLAKAHGEAKAQKEARALLRSILDNKVFSIEPYFDADHVHDLFLSNPKLDYADVVAVSMAVLLEEALCSFDKDQLKTLLRVRERTT